MSDELNRTAPVSAPLDTQALPPLTVEQVVELAEGIEYEDPETGRMCFDRLGFAKAIEAKVRAPYAERIRHLERELERARMTEVLCNPPYGEPDLYARLHRALTGEIGLAEKVGKRPEWFSAARALLDSLEGSSDKRELAERKQASIEPIAWLLKTGHGNRWRDSAPTGEFADKWIPLIDGRTAGTAPVPLMRQAVASVVSRVGDEFRVGWLRPERCQVGTLLYVAAPTPITEQDHFYTFTKPKGWINLLNPGQSWEEWTREQGAPTAKGWKVSGRAPTPINSGMEEAKP